MRASAWLLVSLVVRAMALEETLSVKYPPAMVTRSLIATILTFYSLLQVHELRAGEKYRDSRKGSRVDAAVDEFRSNLGLKLTADSDTTDSRVSLSTPNTKEERQTEARGIVERAIDEHRKSLAIGLRGGDELDRNQPSPVMRPVPMHCKISSANGAVSVEFDASRVGSLASDVSVSYHSPSMNARRIFVIQPKDVTGFYFVHNRLLIYYSTLVDDREAIFDLDYDVGATKGTVSMHLSPVAVGGIPDLQDDAGKVSIDNLPTGALEAH